jgi:hypothetical protein
MMHEGAFPKTPNRTTRTESPFVRYFERLWALFANSLRLARSSQNANPGKEHCMPEQQEIPTDEEVLAALATNPEGLTPTALMAALEAQEHTRENIIRAIQRVLDRGKVCLSDDAKLVPAKVDEPAFA